MDAGRIREPVDAAELIAVGEVLRAHGRRGEVQVRPLTDRPRERFSRLEECVVSGPGTSPGGCRRVVGCRLDGDKILVRLEGVETPEAAAGFAGALLSVARSAVLPPPPGHFYPWQLEGAAVVTPEGRDLGVFAGIEPGVGQELWVIRRDGRETLVPAVPAIVRDVNVAERRVVIDPPEGLFEP
ncbi:MAG: ribosome maturation factor RimM [Candidatus Rokubacteria bacterium]|nr:ribosome maturation factor RimM [Candidatus Rokubacteria bacterium]